MAPKITTNLVDDLTGDILEEGAGETGDSRIARPQ